MGCRHSAPIFPYNPQKGGGISPADIAAILTPKTESDIDSEYIYLKNIKYKNKQFMEDSTLYEKPIVSSFIGIDNNTYVSPLDKTTITDDSHNYLIEKADTLLKQYKKLIKHILKNEKIDIHEFNFEKKLVRDWSIISNYIINSVEDYHSTFKKYNIKYNLLLLHLNPLSVTDEK